MANTVAIEALEKRLAELERKGNALIEVINDLREEDGLPPHPPLGGGIGSGAASHSVSSGQIHNIQPDTFYGKKMQTAVREYLRMRKAADLGPATPREIYEALKAGGFQSDAKSDNVALVSLRALLRRRTYYFHKLPNGNYGLTEWYPDARANKIRARANQTAEENDEEETEAADADASAA